MGWERHVRRPGWLVAAIACLLLAACGVAAPSPSASRNAGTGLAERWSAAISVSAIGADLAMLQRIADEHGGTRAAGTAGYEASTTFVAATLRSLGYEVTLDTLSIPLFQELGESLLSASGGPSLVAGRDFRAMLFSAGGDLQAPLAAVGYDARADPTRFQLRPTGLGCQQADYPSSARGAIVLVQPGPCFRRVQVESAQAAGALALVVAYPQWEPKFVLRPTLLSPDGIRIPVIGATREAGDALAAAAARGAMARLSLKTSILNRTVSNVLAELPGSDDGRGVVVLGGHLDTALEAPGVNDNGSGTMTLLELARRLATLGPTAHPVRFAFWTGEELGFYGSRHYVDGLSGAQRSQIEVYLNFDMLGSANGGRLIYADPGEPDGSGQVTDLFEAYFDRAGLSHERLDLAGASDHFSFAQAGIPVGGLFSGANETKTDADARAFGGRAGELFDACYHRACDRSDRIDRALLEQMARAAAFVAGQLASGAVTISR